jgi:hypothetical protein
MTNTDAPKEVYMTRTQTVRFAVKPWAVPIALFALVAAALALLVLGGGADIFQGIVEDEENLQGEAPGGLAGVQTAVEEVKGPATVVLGSAVPIGLAAGGALMAVGQRKGMQVIATSGATGLLVLLGNGLAA